jgi:quercetin dioxygenase-like cupin family protein
MKIMTMAEIPGKIPAKHYDLLGHPVVDESTGVKTFKVSYTKMEKNGRCDPHVHDKNEQLFIILKGSMMFQFKEGDFLLKAGQAVLVYRGELHSNYNVAEDGNAEYLTVSG